jgi:hypothetical protein
LGWLVEPQLYISERTGRGVPRIVGTYGRGCYEFRENSISLTIPFQRIDVQTEDEASYKVSNNVSNKSNGQEVRLNATQHRIL